VAEEAPGAYKDIESVAESTERAGLARRVAAHAKEGSEGPVVIDTAFVAEALGAPPHLPETAERTTQPGVAVGLAYTNQGGDILFIEATVLRGGKGVRLRLTGQLGDVMRESGEAALSWIRSNAATLGLAEDKLRDCEIHLHVPAGAVPKDGPSAGVTMVVALVSSLSGRCARGNVAMTGEISLRGMVLPIGGVKEKVLAALRAGIRSVMLPRRNQKDLEDVPAEARERLEFVWLDRVEDAVACAIGELPPLKQAA